MRLNRDLDASGLLIAAILMVFAHMIRETWISWRNEKRLRAAGAIEPANDVWVAMAIVYPLSFVAMAVEGIMRGGPAGPQFFAGLVLWVLAKALKEWVIVTLGGRWSFRVLVLPNVPLIARGPYRYMRHPNYLAVALEMAAAAVMMDAPVAGLLFTIVFIEIMRRRVKVEEQALGLRPSSKPAGGYNFE